MREKETPRIQILIWIVKLRFPQSQSHSSLSFFSSWFLPSSFCEREKEREKEEERKKVSFLGNQNILFFFPTERNDIEKGMSSNLFCLSFSLLLFSYSIFLSLLTPVWFTLLHHFLLSHFLSLFLPLSFSLEFRGKKYLEWFLLLPISFSSFSLIISFSFSLTARERERVEFLFPSNYLPLTVLILHPMSVIRLIRVSAFIRILILFRIFLSQNSSHSNIFLSERQTDRRERRESERERDFSKAIQV